jgi:hypothetical protein
VCVGCVCVHERVCMIGCVHESVCVSARVFAWCMSVGCGWEIGISMQIGVCN